MTRKPITPEELQEGRRKHDEAIRQEWIDAVAAQVFAVAIDDSPTDAAALAYDYAEALWNERAKRLKAASQEKRGE